MKKVTQLFFALFLFVAVSGFSQEKKTFKGAMEHANFTEQETIEATKINKEKSKEIKAIRSQKLPKEQEKEQIKAVKQKTTQKIKKVVGPEKMKAMNSYWKK